jgi:hypothetical protein
MDLTSNKLLVLYWSCLLAASTHLKSRKKSTRQTFGQPLRIPKTLLFGALRPVISSAFRPAVLPLLFRFRGLCALVGVPFKFPLFRLFLFAFR